MSGYSVGSGTRPTVHLGEAEPRGRWMVLHTKSRQEKAVARFLTASNRSLYLPLVSRTRLARGRKFISQVPLFPGYVFIRGEREDAFAALSTKRVCRVLEVADQDRFEAEVSSIAKALAARAELKLYPFAVVGSWCRVSRGPFMGIEGWVLERKSNSRLILQIDVLGQGAALEIDADFLEPIDSPRDAIEVSARRPD